MNTDWKEALLAQSRAMGIEPDGTKNVESNEAGAVEDIQRAPLHIAIEKKGRGGKTATIIEGFTCSEERLKSIASDMKNALGTGGSARGGEILIQGERREAVAQWLRSHGYKVK